MTKTETQEAIEKLRGMISPGDTLFTKLIHVSGSGMMRVVDVFLIKDNEPLRLTWSVAKAIGFTYNKNHEGITVGGCGMDVGFEVVFNLGRVLFWDGFECIGDKCPSNDHSNGDRCYTPHHHNDGGYTLRQRWL